MRVGSVFLCMIVVMCEWLWMATVDAAEAASQEPEMYEVIKPNYESWSLFLFCNTNAALDQDRIDDIYSRYERFGDQLGANHLAVWFCKSPMDNDQGWGCVNKAVDIEASQRFCDAYDLDYVNGPFLVVTPNHPGRGVRRRTVSTDEGPLKRNWLSRLFSRNPEAKNYLVVSLRDKDTATITDFHDTIVQTLLRPGRNRSQSNWQTILSAFDYLRMEEDEMVREQIKTSLPVMVYENQQRTTFEVASVDRRN